MCSGVPFIYRVITGNDVYKRRKKRVRTRSHDIWLSEASDRGSLRRIEVRQSLSEACDLTGRSMTRVVRTFSCPSRTRVLIITVLYYFVRIFECCTAPSEKLSFSGSSQAETLDINPDCTRGDTLFKTTKYEDGVACVWPPPIIFLVVMDVLVVVLYITLCFIVPGIAAVVASWESSCIQNSLQITHV